MPRKICICKILECKCKSVVPYIKSNEKWGVKIFEENPFTNNEIQILPHDPRLKIKNYCIFKPKLKDPLWSKEISFEIMKKKWKN